jgi:hypothetical protein
MMGAAKRGHFDIVHRLDLLKDDLLKKISDVLQIPDADRSRIISGEIVISGPPTTQTTPGGSATQTTPGAGSAQTTPGGPPRQHS